MTTEKQVDIPEFLKIDAKKTVTMTELEYYQKTKQYVDKAWACGWWKGFKFAVACVLIIGLGIAYCAARINSLPSVEDWQDPPMSIMTQQ